MLIYTGNRYDSQQDIILIDSLRNRLQEVKYNVLTQSSELMNLTRQSNVEKRLRDTPDSLLRNSITPPFLIKTHDHQPQADEEKIEEVLVDSSELKVKDLETEEETQGSADATTTQPVENEKKEQKQKPAEQEEQQTAEQEKQQPTKTTGQQ
jgi:hypothetical protein